MFLFIRTEIFFTHLIVNIPIWDIFFQGIFPGVQYTTDKSNLPRYRTKQCRTKFSLSLQISSILSSKNSR